MVENIVLQSMSLTFVDDFVVVVDELDDDEVEDEQYESEQLMLETLLVDQKETFASVDETVVAVVVAYLSCQSQLQLQNYFV